MVGIHTYIYFIAPNLCESMSVCTSIMYNNLKDKPFNFIYEEKLS